MRGIGWFSRFWEVRKTQQKKCLLFPPGGRVVAVAPHPDDAVIGCGGSLFKHCRQGDEVTVIYLTDGEAGDPEGKYADTDYGNLRRVEARKGLEVLGVSRMRFLGFVDRGIRAQEELIHSLRETIAVLEPDILYFPSRWERLSDHRKTAQAMQRFAQEYLGELLCMEYEVYSSHRPNLLVDVTDVYAEKLRALKKHQSQLAYLDYVSLVAKRNALRADRFEGSSTYAEAFFSWQPPPKQGMPVFGQKDGGKTL